MFEDLTDKNIVASEEIPNRTLFQCQLNPFKSKVRYFPLKIIIVFHNSSPLSMTSILILSNRPSQLTRRQWSVKSRNAEAAARNPDP